MLMTCKNQEALYVQMILDDLKQVALISTCCAIMCLRYNDLLGVGPKVMERIRKIIISLLYKVVAHSMERTGITETSMDTKQRSVSNAH